MAIYANENGTIKNLTDYAPKNSGISRILFKKWSNGSEGHQVLDFIPKYIFVIYTNSGSGALFSKEYINFVAIPADGSSESVIIGSERDNYGGTVWWNNYQNAMDLRYKCYGSEGSGISFLVFG